MGVPKAYIDANQLSVVSSGGTAPPEMYIPLWWYSGSYQSMNANAASAGSQFIVKGATLTNTTQNILHTLNTNWNPNNKYALEVAIETGNSSYTAYAALWDVTSNAVVSASQISTTYSNSLTVLRSTQFTLAPGHKYAITLWTQNNNTYLTDASLIVFPS